VPDQPHDDDFDADAGREVGPTADATAEELAWRSIVENYGERAQLDESPSPPPAEAPVAPPSDGTPFGGRFGDPSALDGFGVEPDDELTEEAEEGFVPPEPPPLPRLAPDRAVAWAGIFGSPVVLLTALILSLAIPAWLGYLLVVAFVGGFVYLVVQMPREPRDPWDDGAQI
jgi:hypothetical protein